MIKEKSFKVYVYHHCTHRKSGFKCKQPAITDSELKTQLYETIENITIDDETWKLGLELIQAKYKAEINKNKKELIGINFQEERLRDEIGSLIQLRAKNEITEDEFKREKSKINEKIALVKRRHNDNEHTAKTWLELAGEFFDNIYRAKSIIDSGTTEQKQNLLNRISENFLLEDRKLMLKLRMPYDILLKTEYRTNVLGSLDSNQK